MDTKRHRKKKKYVKRMPLLHLPMIIILSAVMAFSGLLGSLPFAGGATGYLAFAEKWPQEQKTEIVLLEFLARHVFGDREPISVCWNLYGERDGLISQHLSKEHFIFELDGKIYNCEKYSDHYSHEYMSTLEPGVHEYKITFRGDVSLGYLPCEYKGTVTVVKKKNYVVSVSVSDIAKVGEPLPISGMVTDEDGNPLAGAEVCLWVTGPNFNEASESEEIRTITDENGVWNYSGTLLTPMIRGTYHLSNLWLSADNMEEYNFYDISSISSESITIEVLERVSLNRFDRLEVNADSVRKSYACGEIFDVTGLKVKGHFTDENGDSYSKSLSADDYLVMPQKISYGRKSVVIVYSELGRTRADAIPISVDHNWDNGKVTKAATTSAAGVRAYTCKRCKATKKETIPKLAKKANPLKIKARTASVTGCTGGKNGKLKKNRTLAVGKVITFTKRGQGRMTYAKASGNKKITINKNTGKVTVKKGLKKGVYKVKVRVKAAGNANYKASSVKTVTFKVRVK